MTRNQIAWFGLAVVALFVAAWMGRYDVQSGNNGIITRKDRWTVSVQLCYGEQCMPLGSR